MLVLDRTLEAKWEDLVKSYCGKTRQNKDLKSSAKTTLTVGFLIGSRTEHAEHILFLSVCPLPETVSKCGEEISYGTKETEQRDVRECLDDVWIDLQANQTTRMLPGGLEVVGIFVLAEKSSFKVLQPVLLRSLKSSAKSNVEMDSRDETIQRMFLLTQESPLGKPVGLMVTVSKDGITGTSSARVLYQSLSWIPLKAQLVLSLSVPLSKEVKKADFKSIFVTVNEPLIESLVTAFATVDGCIRSPAEPLIPKSGGGRKYGDRPERDINIQLFGDFPFGSTAKQGTRVEGIDGEMQLEGTVQGFAAVPEKGTVGQAVHSLKQDLIRSLYSRCQLHYEGMMIVEGESEDCAVIHQMPRRVLVSHPLHPSVKFSDYLFEGDSVEDAVESFRDLLQWEVSPDEISDGIEKPPTSEMLQKLHVPISSCEQETWDASLEKFQDEEAKKHARFDMWPIFYTVLAFLVGLLSYVMYLLLAN